MTAKTVNMLLQRRSRMPFPEPRRAAIATIRERRHRPSDIVAKPAYWASFDRTPEISFWDYIERKLSSFLRESRHGESPDGFTVSRESIYALARILYSTCDSTTIFPTILPDGDGGITAVWYADTMALEILVDCDGSACAIVKADGSISSLRLEQGQPSTWRNVRGHLGAMSVYVKTRNPRWRELIPE